MKVKKIGTMSCTIDANKSKILDKMDDFLGISNLSKPSEKKLNRPIFVKEIELVAKNLLTKEHKTQTVL